jgi:hypothetical protein
MPSTIDGRPLSTSARKRTAVASLVAPLSARYSPAPMPIGSPIADAIVIRMRVPTIALAMPPLPSPAGAGILVKKSIDNVLAPFETM